MLARRCYFFFFAGGEPRYLRRYRRRTGIGAASSFVSLSGGQGEALRKLAEVPVWFVSVLLGGFDQAVEQCARFGPARALGEQPDLAVMFISTQAAVCGYMNE